MRRRLSRWCAVVPAAVGLALLPPGAGSAWAGPYAGTAGDNRAADLWIPVVLVVVVAVAARYAVRRRAAHPAAPVAAAPRPAGRRHRYQPRPTPLPELAAQAAELLVATDDAVLTSGEDVAFAVRQTGEAAAAPYAEAVDYAAGEVAASYRLLRRLEEKGPGSADEDIRRTVLGEVFSRCTQAGRRLDAEAEGFDRLRALEVHAPDALAEVEAAARLLPGRIAGAEADLAALPYAGSAAEPVAAHPGRARALLAFARGSLDQAAAALGTDHGRAAVFLHAAESALARAEELAASASRRAEALRMAGERVERPPAGRYDPLAELRPSDPLLVARCEVGTARDVVRTHRGAVRCPARTRLAAAERALADGSPRTADRLARTALRLAAHDIAAYAPAPSGRRRGLPGIEGTPTALLTGLLLPEHPAGGGGAFGAMSGGYGGSGPPTFGGPHTRPRMGGGGVF
jgi:hypothetical protein